MIKVTIPGQGVLSLKYLVLDYNGTMAVDGKLLPGVKSLIRKLSRDLQIHVLTADTFGIAREKLKGMPLALAILPKKDQDRGKLQFVHKLGLRNSVTIGNGKNDNLMLKGAGLGICLIQKEGASSTSIIHADVVCNSIIDALELLLNPQRLTATLRR